MRIFSDLGQGGRGDGSELRGRVSGADTQLSERPIYPEVKSILTYIVRIGDMCLIVVNQIVITDLDHAEKTYSSRRTKFPGHLQSSHGSLRRTSLAMVKVGII